MPAVLCSDPLSFVRSRKCNTLNRVKYAFQERMPLRSADLVPVDDPVNVRFLGRVTERCVELYRTIDGKGRMPRGGQRKTGMRSDVLDRRF
jgi:hypothetical protein